MNTKTARVAWASAWALGALFAVGAPAFAQETKPAEKTPASPNSSPDASKDKAEKATDKPAAKPAAKPTAKPDPKADAKADAKPGAKPDEKATKPKPQAKPTPKPQAKPSPKPTGKVTSRPVAAKTPKKKTLEEKFETALRLMKTGTPLEKRMARDAWEDFTMRQHTDKEAALLMSMWKNCKDLTDKQSLFYAMKRSERPEFQAIRAAQLENPTNDDFLALALESLGYTEPYKKAPFVARFFEHKNPVVRVSALKSFLSFMAQVERNDGDAMYRPGPRASVIFKHFRPALEGFLKSETPTLRAGALCALMMLSKDLESVPLKHLQAAAHDKSGEVRHIVASIGQSNLDLAIEPELVHLLDDEIVSTRFRATVALYTRLNLRRRRALRNRAFEPIRKDLKKDKSKVKTAPHLLKLLADRVLSEGKRKRALELYRLSATASQKGGMEPPLILYHAGATSRCLAALLLVDEGKTDAAWQELCQAYLDFHPSVQVKFDRKTTKPLIDVLNELRKTLPGVRRWPIRPPTANKRRSHGQAGLPRIHGAPNVLTPSERKKLAAKKKAASQPASKPHSKPSSKPSSRPTSQPASKPSK